MSPVNLTYWVIPGYVIFWGVTVLAVGLFLRRLYQLWCYLSLGQNWESLGQMARRVPKTALHVLGQWCQLKNLTLKDRASLGHAFMAWGFFTFVVFYLVFIIIGAGFGLSDRLENTRFFFFYAWVMDIAAPFVMVGALWGIVRRYIIKPPRLEGEQTVEAAVILVTVLIHPLTHLFKEATSIALGHPPAGLGTLLPPLSSALSNLFRDSSVSSVEVASVAFFWAHWVIVLFVLVFIGYSRYLHVVASVINLLLPAWLDKGALRPIDLEKAESFGVARITDFNRKQLLDLYACVVCGSCQEQCPAFASGKSLSPKKLIQDLKKHLLSVGPELVRVKAKVEAITTNPAGAVPGEVVTEDEIWACTTCRACDEICPVSVEHVDKIIDMRRNLVMEKSQLPETAQEALQCLGARGHPWRGTTATRTAWANGLKVKTLSEDSDIDILYWVGCTAALEDRNMKVSAATARILQAAGVNFGMLGAEESCCGDPARRMGDEYLFQTLCQKNIEFLKSYNIKKILTTCPHCFHTLKNEYPQFGGNFEVVHHTQFIADLLANGKLKLGGLDGNKRVAYHDSCYLGRYNDIYQPPQAILRAIGGIKRVELPRSGTRSFCCGGGGGHMWLEEEPHKRVNVRRTEEVIQARVDLVATACPYCLSMFEDGLKTKGVEESIKALDLSELVAQALR